MVVSGKTDNPVSNPTIGYYYTSNTSGGFVGPSASGDIKVVSPTEAIVTP